MRTSHILDRVRNGSLSRQATGATRIALLFSAWAGVLLIGFGALEIYKVSPGAQGAPFLSRPDSELKNGKEPVGPLKLQLFMHAYCPCTRATLAELGRIAKAATVPMTIEIVVVQPPQDDANWRSGLAAEAASLLPDAAILLDAQGRIAAQAGALTSGYVVLSDAAGRVLFRGGITPARGHEGENEGRKALLAWTQGRAARISRTPVFGCAFTAPGRDERGVSQ
ncbi:thioredoxin domain-containing protein [Planctomicrobium piriforme]|uniref:RedB protein n=1 Tax=Planctomicrobium piriforme TaxID=1576369 RepID=A0A1I3SPW2_9PLAN|nr:hypothetical protein [Planctomicrobium piriforme]SFJ60775.1 hypothetical protein SAMN05421753_12534 [Planctomicrobium piriforme]